MFILKKPSIEDKLNILTGYAKYDISCSCGEGNHRVNAGGRWFYPAVLPDGRKVILLKILQSSFCENNCNYCALRKGRNIYRTYIPPETLARITYEFYKKGLIKGLFLTSGIVADPVKTQTKMIDTVRILREKYRFKGYIHLKILPGVDIQSIETAVKLSTRVSLNLEAPEEEGLKSISPDKRFGEMMNILNIINRVLKAKGKGSMTTQFIVGASHNRDVDYVNMLFKLYKDYRMGRVYFSAFQPIKDTPFENHPPSPPLREHRLYQVDFLIRRYGFKKEDIVFREDGNLDINMDPKLLWARRHGELFPVDINRADYEILIRVPGIGPVTAKKILKLRKYGGIKDIRNLKKLGISLKRTAGYITLSGKKVPHIPLIQF